jgi:hypothetical protein
VSFNINTMGACSGAGTTFPSRVTDFILGFLVRFLLVCGKTMYFRLSFFGHGIDCPSICEFRFFFVICLFFSSPGPKGQVRYCHHLASIVRPLTFSHFNLLLWNSLAKLNQTWQGFSPFSFLQCALYNWTNSSHIFLDRIWLFVYGKNDVFVWQTSIVCRLFWQHRVQRNSAMSVYEFKSAC